MLGLDLSVIIEFSVAPASPAIVDAAFEYIVVLPLWYITKKLEPL